MTAARPAAATLASNIPSSVLDQAVDWAVKLQSGTASAEARAAWSAWRAAHAMHEQAWQQIEAVENSFRNIPPASGAVARHTLESAARRRAVQPGRRRALKVLGLGFAGLASGLLVMKQAPWQQRESYTAAVGERRRIALADGTRIQINTASAINVVFSPLRRLIVLEQGEIAIDTGADADSFTGRRPFWVETAQARLEAIGTRFTVRRAADETRVHVTEGVVAIHAGAARVVLVRAGETFRVQASAPAPVRVNDPSFDPAAWTDGVIVAKQMRLDAFVTELSRYRSAPIQCDPAIAGWRVSGVFQLEGADPANRALAALANALPVRITARITAQITAGPDQALIITQNR